MVRPQPGVVQISGHAVQSFLNLRLQDGILPRETPERALKPRPGDKLGHQLIAALIQRGSQSGDYRLDCSRLKLSGAKRLGSPFRLGSRFFAPSFNTSAAQKVL